MKLAYDIQFYLFNFNTNLIIFIVILFDLIRKSYDFIHNSYYNNIIIIIVIEYYCCCYYLILYYDTY